MIFAHRLRFGNAVNDRAGYVDESHIGRHEPRDIHGDSGVRGKGVSGITPCLNVLRCRAGKIHDGVSMPVRKDRRRMMWVGKVNSRNGVGIG